MCLVGLKMLCWNFGVWKWKVNLILGFWCFYCMYVILSVLKKMVRIGCVLKWMWKIRLRMKKYFVSLSVCFIVMWLFVVLVVRNVVWWCLWKFVLVIWCMRNNLVWKIVVIWFIWCWLVVVLFSIWVWLMWLVFFCMSWNVMRIVWWKNLIRIILMKMWVCEVLRLFVFIGSLFVG